MVHVGGQVYPKNYQFFQRDCYLGVLGQTYLPPNQQFAPENGWQRETILFLLGQRSYLQGRVASFRKIYMT